MRSRHPGHRPRARRDGAVPDPERRSSPARRRPTGGSRWTSRPIPPWPRICRPRWASDGSHGADGGGGPARRGGRRRHRPGSIPPPSDLAAMAALGVRCVIVTAAGDRPGIDCVSRVFAPAAGIAEDPVTGSAHCTLWLRSGRSGSAGPNWWANRPRPGEASSGCGWPATGWSSGAGPSPCRRCGCSSDANMRCMGNPTTARRMWRVFDPLHAVTYFAPECDEEFRACGLKGFWMGYFAGRSRPHGCGGAGGGDGDLLQLRTPSWRPGPCPTRGDSPHRPRCSKPGWPVSTAPCGRIFGSERSSAGRGGGGRLRPAGGRVGHRRRPPAGGGQCRLAVAE